MHYPVMTEKQVAARWNVSQKTLRRWRLDNEGPTWHKLFRLVRYHEADVLAFEQRSSQFWGEIFGERIARALDEQAQVAAADADDQEQSPEIVYISAKEAAAQTGLPIHIFQDRAERERKRIPHLMLVGNLRFSLQAILEWELANSVPGNAVAAAVDEIESQPEAPSPAKRWYELVREQDGERFDSPM